MAGKYRDEIVVKGEARQQLQRTIDKANKRLSRLEAKDLTDNPAYQSFMKNSNGNTRFSIRGLQGRKLEQAMQQANYFLNLKSSTISGANEVLAGVAERAGLSVEEIKADKDVVGQIWKLVDQARQYMESAGIIAANYDSTQIAQVVSQYVKEQRNEMNNSVDDIMEIVKRFTGMDKEADDFNDSDIESDDYYRLL